MAKDEKIFTLRIDSKLLDYLKKRADRNSRSIAKELEYIIKKLYIEDNEELELLLKKVFSAYEKEKDKTDLRQLIEDDTLQTPLKDAALELIDFVKSLDG